MWIVRDHSWMDSTSIRGHNRTHSLFPLAWPVEFQHWSVTWYLLMVPLELFVHEFNHAWGLEKESLGRVDLVRSFGVARTTSLSAVYLPWGKRHEEWRTFDWGLHVFLSGAHSNWCCWRWFDFQHTSGSVLTSFFLDRHFAISLGLGAHRNDCEEGSVSHVSLRCCAPVGVFWWHPVRTELYFLN